eukprot:SM000098S25078  [mRNA]  locus=s98:10910:13295:- [translate_table: standard]
MFSSEERIRERAGRYGTPRFDYLQRSKNFTYITIKRDDSFLRRLSILLTSSAFLPFQALVAEFQETRSQEAKEQIVANLANFAYDPINYDHLRKLHVVDLFLDCLTEPNELLVEFGIGGISNCSPDPKNAAVILESEGLPHIIACLSSPVENTVLSAISSLYYLCNRRTEKEILAPAVLQCMQAYAEAEAANKRFSNAAKAFLGKYAKKQLL